MSSEEIEIASMSRSLSMESHAMYIPVDVMTMFSIFGATSVSMAIGWHYN